MQLGQEGGWSKSGQEIRTLFGGGDDSLPNTGWGEPQAVLALGRTEQVGSGGMRDTGSGGLEAQ